MLNPRSLVTVAVLVLMLAACRTDETVIIPLPDPLPPSLSDFESAQSCRGCHPHQYDQWSGSTHHYAANDPIWVLASNSVQASTQGRLKDWCFQCHAPIAFITGTAPKTAFQLSELPPIVREGVTCDACHTMRPPYKTTNQNIEITFRPGRTKYGTISDPVPTSAHNHGFDPSFSRSENCRACHDLIVNNVPVEITFTEWQNSPWGGMSVECQDCHMPRYTGRAAVGGPIRDNLRRHDFIGVGVALTDFPNREEQRAAVAALLREAATMTVETPAMAPAADSITTAVTVYNDKTGHNLPTSVFFNRQMWIEVTVWQGADTVYRSGHVDANGDLMDDRSVLQPNADPDLVLFGGRLYKQGVETNVFEMDSMTNHTLPPFGSRTASYRFMVTQTGTWNVEVRLLFRPFGPYLLRALGADELIPELPIFEMAKSTSSIHVH